MSTESIGDNLEVYGYDGFGNIIKTISQNAFDTKGVISYNEYDNVKRTVTAITKNLDFDGTDAEETEVSRSVTTYDLMGRTVKVENGFSNGTALETKTFTYDYMGNVLTETDGEGNTTSYAYNDLGQLLAVTDALSGITSYTYDLAGNVASLETPGESVTSYTYDTLGRLISETDALGKTEYYRYDANGNVTGIKDRNLNVITTAYDAANRPVSKAGGSLLVTYDYDAFDNLTEMVDATGTTEFSYTYDNLLESISYPDEKTLFYSYSPEDNTVTKENYREEETVSHFDSLGREVAIYENEDAIAEFVYNGGTIEKAIYENGSTDYSYDNAMRLTGLTSSLTGATGNIGEYFYEYDNRGNQTKKTEIKNGESLVTEYTYDALSRLSSVTEPDGSVTSYSFDDNGNISAKSITHPEAFVFTSGDISVSGITSHTVTYTYDANNRLLTETEEVEGDREFTGTKTYTYDDAGNLIGKTTGGDYGAKTESYVYDAFGRMTEYKVGGETVATYGYNGNGERVSKTVGESLTKFYLENGNVLNEGNGTALNVTNYFGATGIFKRVTGDAESILYKNGHGDVVRKTSGTSVLRDYDYDAYGKEKTAMADDNPFRYAGEYTDQETGLIYLRARYYDSSIGRFTAEDPARDGLNWYVYCSNNPINRVDPRGENWTTTWSASAWWISGVDGPIPAGEFVYVTGIVICVAIDGIISVSQPKVYDKKSEQKAKSSSSTTSNLTGAAIGGAAPDPEDPKNWNKNSTRIDSKNLYDKDGVRVDVENPNPAERAGQVHIHIKKGANKGKYIFDNVTKQLYEKETKEYASKAVQDYLNNPDVMKAINKGLYYLGVN